MMGPPPSGGPSLPNLKLFQDEEVEIENVVDPAMRIKLEPNYSIIESTS